MSTRIHSVAFEGVACVPVEVQVQLSPGLPRFTLVGLPDKAVAESRERVRAALHALGLTLPAKHVTVNLAPADLQKEGSHFDLPILLGLLAAMNALPQDAVDHHVILGELALDGRISPVAGVLPAALAASERGLSLICPAENGAEAAWIGGDMEILAAPDVLSLINHAKGLQPLPVPVAPVHTPRSGGPDLANVVGLEHARRALEVAAAGGHNLLMIGPPGAGKSMLASCLPGILPPMSPLETLEASMIASVAGKIEGGRISDTRPFRDPHHSSSMAAMVGGGRRAQPGEISLAHRGVLFLDELPEFPKQALEAMRQPLETGTVSIARAAAHITYPARFQLIAAMNPCRCGYLGDAERACSKAPICGTDYQARLSGPLLDRIDLQIEVPASDSASLLRPSRGEPSAAVAARVARARQVQQARFAAAGSRLQTNAEMGAEEIQTLLNLSDGARGQMERAAEHFRLSMRAVSRLLKVARSIADLDGSDSVESRHAAEAVAYRQPNWVAGLKRA